MEGVVVGLCRAQHLCDGLLFGQRRNWERQLRKVAPAQTAAPVHRSAGADLEDVLVEPGLEYGKGVIGIHLLGAKRNRSEEHTYELQSLMRNSYAVICLKKKHNR